MQYLKVAAKFAENNSNVQYSLKFNLYLRYAQALFLNENYPQAEEKFEIAFSYAKRNADYAKLLWNKTMFYFAIGNNEMTTTTGLEALSKVGVHLRVKPLRIRTVLEMVKLIWISHESHVIKYQAMNKKNTLNEAGLLIDIMATLSMSAIICHPELFKVLMLLIGQISIKSGDSEYISLGYTESGIMAGSIFYNFERERELRDLSLALASKCEDNNHYINFLNSLFVNYWLDDWHKNIVCFDIVYKSEIEEGKFVSAASILLLKIVFLYCTGTNINDLIIKSQNTYNQIKNLQAKFYTECLLCIKKAFEAIRVLDTEATYFSFLKYSIPIISNPATNSRKAITIGKVIPLSDIVVKKRPGGVDQPETILLPAKTIIASSHIVPINDKKPPIIAFFISIAPSPNK